MAKKNSKTHKPYKTSRTNASFGRKENCRDVRILIVFNFKDFIPNQPEGNEQSFESWEQDGILSKFLEKLKHISSLTLQEAKQQNIITEYDKFPDNTDFECPKKFRGGVRWSVIKKITGQKARIIGHIVDNIFYVVFLDKDHQFWKTKKKHT